MLNENVERLLKLALALTSQEWGQIGIGDDPYTKATDDKGIIVERITSLLVVRCVPLVLQVKQLQQQQQQSSSSLLYGSTKPATSVFTNLSTSCICQQLLDQTVPWPDDLLTEEIIAEMRTYVDKMITQYKDVPYHNRQHAVHVVVSVNKLLDMMVSGKNQIEVPEMNGSKPNYPYPRKASSPSFTSTYVTYGLRHDPIALFALVYAALIHDVEHQGIPNRQLALEDDRLAVLYNDQSMAENWSLYVGFSELLQTDFAALRKVILQEGTDDYRRFRRIVIDLVLSTDIASPERTQINKSKWKEAFGDPYETIERKLRLVAMNNTAYNASSNAAPAITGRRFSLTGRHIMATRRASNLSTISAVSFQNHSIDGGQGYQDDMNIHDDESFSATPEASESEHENENGSLHNKQSLGSMKSDALVAAAAAAVSSTGKGSAAPGWKKFERRMSAASCGTSVNTAKYRQRLGILRTVDLSGETIETYSRRGSMVSTDGLERSGSYRVRNNAASNGGGDAIPENGTSNGGSPQQRVSVASTAVVRNVTPSSFVSPKSNGGIVMGDDSPGGADCNVSNMSTNPALYYEADEPDELKASVVMETMITAADVAHNLQGWDHMVIWSGRLYLELRRAYVTGRGTDPSDRWFENQIGFLESYLLPLARRLEDTGVFNESILGSIFSSTVESNRDRWLTEGFEITQQSIDEGNEIFPLQQQR